MTVINTNVGALTARTYALKANDAMQQSMERLSSGLRINSAADDAAGMAVSNKMESQLRGMNVAIRNSQDGISLVQTAEAGMGEITNMIIRMRELSVQMNNGVYTDADRTNAQLEVTALLAEIDKIATNTAFNDVKVLDGSYQKDLRAGNTNVEVIGVNIKRMNTDSLGGTTISSTATTTAVAADRTSTSNTQSSIVASAVESTKIELKADKLSTTMQAFATANAGGTYTISGTNSSLYQVNGTTIESQAAVAYSTAAGATNSHTFDVTYTSGANVYKDSVTLNITQNTNAATVKSATTTLAAAEATAMSFATTDLSSNLATFVSANTAGATNGGWSVSGTDASLLSISTAGTVTVTGGTDRETKASYAFNVEFATNTGDKFVEGVTLNVTDLAERQITLTAPTVPSVVYAGDTFAVVADGKTITHTMAAGNSSYAIADVVADLNTRNDAMEAASAGTGADGKFSVSGSNIVFTFDPAATVQTTTISAAGLAYTPANRTGTVSVTTQGAAAVSEVMDFDLSSDYANVRDTDIFTITDGVTSLAVAAWSAGTPGTASSAASTLVGLIQAHANYSGADYTVAVNSDSDGITMTMKPASAGVFTESNATLISADNAGTAGTLTQTVDTQGAAAIAEVVDFVAPTIPTIVAGDKISVDVGGATVTTSALTAGANLAAVVAALNTAEGATNFAVSNTNDIRYTFAAGGAQTDNTHVALNYIPKEGAVSVSTAGVNAPAAVTAAATNTSVAGTATAQIASNFATRTSTEIVQAKSTISLVESAKIKFDKTAMSTGFSTYVAAHTGGKYTLTGTDAASFSIDQTTGMVKNELNMDFETKASFDINVVYTDTNSKTFTEAVNLVLTDSTADSGTHLADLNVGTQSGAASAITILDTALNQISASQAELGAVQNRLQHNIDNLSMGSMLTETARGRIVDADFAKETSELSKQQILSQAATSMLAQANQSKQSVLALLQ